MRTKSESRRQAILATAAEAFHANGLDATSMSEVAARLGGSKGTLYNYFKSKDELFTAYVERRCLWQQDEIFALTAGETPVQALHRIARSFLTHMLNETTLRNFRLIVAEAERTPQISRDFYDAGPRRGTDRLAAFLASLEADGILDLDGDPTSAASHFMGLVQSTTFKGRLCNAIPTLTPDQIAADGDGLEPVCAG